MRLDLSKILKDLDWSKKVLASKTDTSLYEINKYLNSPSKPLPNYIIDSINKELATKNLFIHKYELFTHEDISSNIIDDFIVKNKTLQDLYIKMNAEFSSILITLITKYSIPEEDIKKSLQYLSIDTSL